MRPLVLLPLLPLLLAGCHAKFKREAPTLGEVRTQVVTTGGPYVELGQLAVATDNPLANLAIAAVNISQEVKGANLAGRIAGAVDIESINRSFNDGIAQTLQAGPPFAYTDSPEANATMQVEVLSYGLYVPSLGAPGVFTYDIRVRIYKKDGDRVYTTRHQCEIGAGTPDVTEAVLGVVNNVREIDEMSDAEINQAFATMAAWCGQTFVVKMRRHAG